MLTTDRAMLGPAKYERVPDDLYRTIDPRCAEHLGKVWDLHERPFVEPCAGTGTLIKHLEDAGAKLEWASDLRWYEDADKRIQGGVDIFDHPPKGPVTIITNLPFASQQAILGMLLGRCPAAWIVLLTRASQMHVKGMRALMTDRLYGWAPLPFRPFWFDNPDMSPRHEYGWLLIRPAHYVQREPVLML